MSKLSIHKYAINSSSYVLSKEKLENIKVSLLPETLQITDLTNESPEEHKLL